MSNSSNSGPVGGRVARHETTEPFDAVGTDLTAIWDDRRGREATTRDQARQVRVREECYSAPMNGYL
jgi:hypothetical protein